ncbi:MAG: hypothetical protein HYU70_08640 [Bacteroidetes bacterium]|nr:hypothetical protein [Bacteroidota bacterium]
MESQSYDTELRSIAGKELEQIEQCIPDDPAYCFVLLTEMTRMYDYLSIGNVPSEKLSPQQLDIIKNGWNLAAAYFFKPLNFIGFPICKSDDNTRNYAISLLYKLGCTVLLKRVADMVETGILTAIKEGNTFTFRKSIEAVQSQYLDTLEFSYLNKLDEKLNSAKEAYYGPWNLISHEELPDIFFKPGNFFSRDQTNFDSYKISDIDSKMLPLIQPWNSGYGIMMAYDTTPEIDNHFLAIAAELVQEFRNDAGIHPNADIEGVKGADLAAVMIFIVSIHLKHVHYASLAAKNCPEISIPESLTIWEPIDKLIEAITDFSGMNTDIVSKVFDLIMLKADDVSLLKTHTSKFMPVIINMGNGYILRPVSSLLQNPFFSILAVLEHRNPKIRHHLSLHREEWLRSFINATFAGTRYQTLWNNIKLRDKNSIITDIDAAVYDNLTGEMALIQIKWQDFFYNDVKKLRSKASNLTKELDEWAEKVTQWIASKDVNELVKAIGIRLTKKISRESVYLFGISRNVARVQGYGFKTKSENLAISNWPQFARNRLEIGPAERVIHTLFQTLKKQENETISAIPLPTTIQIADITFHFEDLWSGFEN